MYNETYIENAGLVILSSFIPLLFERLGLVMDSAFNSVEDQEKAALLLQYILLDNPPKEEHHLVLNKLFAGLPLDHEIKNDFSVTPDELNTIHSLIEAVIAHWSAIGKSSIEGFRGSWLWRNGKLEEMEENWVLTVERNVYDILIDRLPLSITPIKFFWMPKPIMVNWQ